MQYVHFQKFGSKLGAVTWMNLLCAFGAGCAFRVCPWPERQKFKGRMSRTLLYCRNGTKAGSFSTLNVTVDSLKPDQATRTVAILYESTVLYFYTGLGYDNKCIATNLALGILLLTNEGVQVDVEDGFRSSRVYMCVTWICFPLKSLIIFGPSSSYSVRSYSTVPCKSR